jgi:hypothetical protein
LSAQAARRNEIYGNEAATIFEFLYPAAPRIIDSNAASAGDIKPKITCARESS